MCKLTTQSFGKFNPWLESKCTRIEYENGIKESYTPNSFRASFRHNRTNYDELIKDLDRYSVSGKIYYQVIRKRIETMVEDQIVKDGVFDGSILDFEPDDSSP